MRRYLRISALGAVVAGLCVITLSLNGCGRREEGPAKEVKAIDKKAKGKPQEKEMPVPSTAPITEERTYYDFETSDLNGWEVPMWALDKTDYVARGAELSRDVASHGDASMKVTADFPGGLWSVALVEIQQYLVLSSYRVVRADIYLPKDAPVGLKAKLILTVGNNWKFVEMSRSVPLIPGEWVTITANIEPGSYDWKRVVPDEKFSEDVRKIAIRIESNRKPKYSGPIYIDNVRVGR